MVAGFGSKSEKSTRCTCRVILGPNFWHLRFLHWMLLGLRTLSNLKADQRDRWSELSSHSLLISCNFVHQAVFVLVAFISFSMNTTRHAQRSMKSRLLVLATSTLLTNKAPRYTVLLTVNLSASPGPLHPSYLHSHCHYEAQFGKSISSQQVQLMFTLAMHFYQLASRVPTRPCSQRTWPTGGFFGPM